MHALRYWSFVQETNNRQEMASNTERVLASMIRKRTHYLYYPTYLYLSTGTIILFVWMSQM